MSELKREQATVEALLAKQREACALFYRAVEPVLALYGRAS